MELFCPICSATNTVTVLAKHTCENCNTTFVTLPNESKKVLKKGTKNRFERVLLLISSVVFYPAIAWLPLSNFLAEHLVEWGTAVLLFPVIYSIRQILQSSEVPILILYLELFRGNLKLYGKHYFIITISAFITTLSGVVMVIAGLMVR